MSDFCFCWLQTVNWDTASMSEIEWRSDWVTWMVDHQENKSKTTWWLGVVFLLIMWICSLFVLLSCFAAVVLFRLWFWHQPVQSSVFFCQRHEGPQHRLGRRRSSGRCTSKKTMNNVVNFEEMMLTAAGVCVCVFTNSPFCLCLMLSAVGRHAVQGQLCRLPPTCVLCVFRAVWNLEVARFPVISSLSVTFRECLSPVSLQKKPARRRYENYSMYSDDDANSDASSACSERSYSSRNGGSIPTYMRQTEDVAEVSGI